jgi:hypothetical protein
MRGATATSFAGQTVEVLRRIERLLERQAYEAARSGTEELTIEEDRGRNGYFSSVWGPTPTPALTLRWHPGTEGLFPTFDQMAEAKSLWPQAVEWDFSVLGRRDSHYFGIPLNFHQT